MNEIKETEWSVGNTKSYIREKQKKGNNVTHYLAGKLQLDIKDMSRKLETKENGR